MDTLLSSYLKKTLDSRIPGFFAAGVKRGYSLSDELKSRESILQLFEAQNAYGMLRHVCVDIAIQNEAKRLGLGITVEQKRVSKNGYTYPVLFDDNAVFTLHKTRSKKAMPTSAWNRKNRSFLNREISLFDDFDKPYSEEKSVPYLMVTYGGLNYKLSYVQIGLPNVGATRWIDTVDISKALATVKPLDVGGRKKLKLAFNDRVEQMLEGEKTNDGGQV